jgi:hypothetical protein
VTYDVLFLIQIGTREVHVAGVTPHPDQRWMTQMARHMTMVDWGFLSPGQYLIYIYDQDGKYCPAFQQVTVLLAHGSPSGMFFTTLNPDGPAN